MELAELADDDGLIPSLVDAGIAVFDFLSGERSKEELFRVHKCAIAAVEEKYPSAFDAPSKYRLAAQARYLEYAATQMVYNVWMAQAEKGDTPLRRTPTGHWVRLDQNASEAKSKDAPGVTARQAEGSTPPNEKGGEDGVQATFIGAFLGAVLGVGAIATIALWATVAIATMAVLALAVIPPSVSTSGWNPAWSTVG